MGAPSKLALFDSLVWQQALVSPLVAPRALWFYHKLRKKQKTSPASTSAPAVGDIAQLFPTNAKDILLSSSTPEVVRCFTKTLVDHPERVLLLDFELSANASDVRAELVSLLENTPIPSTEVLRTSVYPAALLR
mmetsp:Transcript_17216/g.33542  ORF Transcript_17216/g.33542 Transcript_17216/m.33542 type:complete len:134 (-) Transcript_17216:326-727(-)